MDQKEQNLQISVTDFKSSIYKSARKAILAYSIPLEILNG